MPERRPTGRSGFRGWLVAATALILAGVAVPYGLLGGGDAGLGVALFWLGFGLAVTALILAGTAGWRD